MSRICSIPDCKKRPRVGNIVSHANNKVKRWVYPNVHKMRYILIEDPKKKVINSSVCTKCVKAGKIQKII